MTIKVGDSIPAVKWMVWGEKGPEPVMTDTLFKGKVVAFFGVPGAFTPKCSEAHLPGFVQSADALKAKGVQFENANQSHEVRQRQHAEQMQRAGDRSNDAFMNAGRR